jgi:hypothetical protein
MEIRPCMHPAFLRPSAAPAAGKTEETAPKKPFLAQGTQTAADILCLMDLDETTAALVGSADHMAVNTMGVLDGLKVMGLGAARLESGRTRGDREAMLDGGARVALGAGSMIPGLVGNFFVGATGLYLAAQGLRHKDTAQAIAGTLQVGVAVGFYAIGAGAGLPAQAAILALQAGKIGTYLFHARKHADATDSDRLGRFMHGYLHRHDHWGKVEEPGRGKVWADSPHSTLRNFSNLALESKPLSLAGVKNPVLAFDLRHDLEAGADFMHVEVKHGERDWHELEKVSGQSDWTEHRLDLSEYQDRSDLQVRFRSQTDASQHSTGCYLDRVRVEAADRSVVVRLQPHQGDVVE